MIYTNELCGIPLQTGDLICTTDGKEDILPGELWHVVGKLVPGPVDHVIIYVGPGGLCVEAGAKLKVITFEFQGHEWHPERLVDQRGPLLDTFYGIAYPLAGIDPETAAPIRESVAAYCLAQAAAGKPYNLHFHDSDTEEAFYCSQLAYKAYLPHGINLNTGAGVPNVGGTTSIIFPQEIWAGCEHRQG